MSGRSLPNRAGDGPQPGQGNINTDYTAGGRDTSAAAAAGPGRDRWTYRLRLTSLVPTHGARPGATRVRPLPKRDKTAPERD